MHAAIHSAQGTCTGWTLQGHSGCRWAEASGGERARAQLFTHRADVDALNARQLASCGGERVAFEALDAGSSDALAACLARPKLGSKVGYFTLPQTRLRHACAPPPTTLPPGCPYLHMLPGAAAQRAQRGGPPWTGDT